MSLKSGLDIDESLTLAEKLVDYEPLRKQIAVCREDMKNGESFPKALKESHIFGGMQERLMVIGYETGATDEVMEQSAEGASGSDSENDRHSGTNIGWDFMCDRRSYFAVCYAAISRNHGRDWIREACLEKSFSKTNKNKK